jgi:hypothetical protein
MGSPEGCGFVVTNKFRGDTLLVPIGMNKFEPAVSFDQRNTSILRLRRRIRSDFAQDDKLRAAM